MSTHLDGPVVAAPLFRPADRPRPARSAVLAWSLVFAAATVALAWPVVRDEGATPVVRLGLMVFHLVVTLPLAMALALFAVSAALAVFVGAAGVAARVLRPRTPTGAGTLCVELLVKGSLVLPGYLAAFRRVRNVGALGLMFGFPLGLLLVAALGCAAGS